MFKIGTTYEFVLLHLCEEGYEPETFTGRVSKVDGFLVELNEDKVINTASPLFLRAKNHDKYLKNIINAEKIISGE